MKTSQVKEISKEKQRGKAKQRREAKRSKVKKSEDSSCSLLFHFWSTSRSPFSTCYIPFQSSGSKEYNASKFAQPMRRANFPLFLHARTTDFPDIFSLIFSRVNSICNLVFSRHKALSCNFDIYRGAQCLQKILDDWGIDPLYINLEIYKALFFSIFLFFPISIFLVAKQPLRAFPQRMIG